MADQLSRRSFLKQGAAAGTAAAAGLASGTLMADVPSPTLYVAKGEPTDAVKRVLAAMGGMESFVKEGQRVVIKPNMSFAASPEEGCNTHPAVVAAVTKACIDAGAKKVVIMDHTLRDPVVCKEKSGIAAALADIPKTTIFTPNQEKFYTDVDIPKGLQLKKVQLATVLHKADVFINIPTAKSHSATGVSFGMKAGMGIVWDRHYWHKAVDCNQAIADLGTLVKPALTIMDAIYALTTNGPAGPGQVEKLDTVIGGTDPVAVDSYTTGIAKWYGKSFKGSQVKYIKLAADMGLGEMDVEKITVKTV